MKTVRGNLAALEVWAASITLQLLRPAASGSGGVQNHMEAFEVTEGKLGTHRGHKFYLHNSRDFTFAMVAQTQSHPRIHLDRHEYDVLLDYCEIRLSPDAETTERALQPSGWYTSRTDMQIIECGLRPYQSNSNRTISGRKN